MVFFNLLEIDLTPSLISVIGSYSGFSRLHYRNSILKIFIRILGLKYLNHDYFFLFTPLPRFVPYFFMAPRMLRFQNYSTAYRFVLGSLDFILLNSRLELFGFISFILTNLVYGFGIQSSIRSWLLTGLPNSRVRINGSGLWNLFPVIINNNLF